MAGFMEHRLNVALQADRVHKDEWQPRFGQRRLITARRFALAILQIEQPIVEHAFESIAQSAVDMVENGLCAAGHLFNFPERAERGTLQWIDGRIPRSQRIKLELRFSFAL